MLNLSNTRLNSFPEVITDLKSLKILYLRKNKISKIPKSILDMNRLEYLDLNENLIMDDDDILNELREKGVKFISP